MLMILTITVTSVTEPTLKKNRIIVPTLFFNMRREFQHTEDTILIVSLIRLIAIGIVVYARITGQR